LRITTEGLETRHLLSVSGSGTSAAEVSQPQGFWGGATALTYSFVPDGTDVFGAPSKLNAALAAQGISTAQWQSIFEEAAAIWSDAVGIPIRLVPDNGAPIGTDGPAMGDPRFGDIRIAGLRQAPFWVGGAFAPSPTNTDTVAGDILVNTLQCWSANSTQASTASSGHLHIDLLTVALNEFDQALGIGPVNDPSAVLAAGYNGPKTALTPADFAAIAAFESSTGPTAGSSSNSNADNASPWTATLSATGDSTTASLTVTSPTYLESVP
jgi:hypothetical protein